MSPPKMKKPSNLDGSTIAIASTPLAKIATPTRQQYNLNFSRGQGLDAAAVWTAVCRQLDLTRPGIVAAHRLYEAPVRFDHGRLVVELPADSAAWLRRFAAAKTEPLELAARFAGWPGLQVEFETAGVVANE